MENFALCTDLLDLTEWTKSKEIMSYLKDKVAHNDLNRKFRSDVAINNRMFLNGDRDHYIVHGSKGYKWAVDENEIQQSLKDLERRAMTMLVNVSQTRKTLSQRDQGCFENRVAEFRKEKGMTANDLVAAVKADYPRLPLDASLLSKIETGKCLPNHITMAALSEALAVSAVKLFGASALFI